MNIETRIERKRGCGYRKPGGLYLISGGFAKACYKLPIPLTVCPCCNQGIKPARGFTWISSEFIKDSPCKNDCEKECFPFNGMVHKFGLIWVGEKFYPTPNEFTKEAVLQGISRRIAQIPKDLVIGETWVLLAHRKVMLNKEPGIFQAFKVMAIEYVVKEEDSLKKLRNLDGYSVCLRPLALKGAKIEKKSTTAIIQEFKHDKENNDG